MRCGGDVVVSAVCAALLDAVDLSFLYSGTSRDVFSL